tara:strand:+ start:1735 stop:2103 length:369 start_codon:yes stop_codon:yes gene_type:complete
MRYIKSNRLARILKRSEYLRVKQRGTSVAKPGLVIQATPGKNDSSFRYPRVGFTVSKRVGNAVKRNKARRRLKSIASDVLPKEGFQAWDYVFIGRLVTLDRPYDLLLEDARAALRKIHQNTI